MKPTDPRIASSNPYDDGVPHHEPGVHDELHNEDVGHEHIDVDLRGIVTSVVILGAVALAAQFGMYLLFGWFEARAANDDPTISRVAVPATEMPKSTTGSPFFSTGVSGPRLLTNEPMALEQQRAEERGRLESYGWVDQSSGVARVPIEEAKKLLIQRGVPVREGASAPAFMVRPPARGEASGGRAITIELPEPPADVPAGEQQAKPH
jgi:hypothetical protein